MGQVDNLMKPRYKVIALWPNTQYKVGDILQPDYYIEKTIKFCETYPHLFRKLEWWEDREYSLLPQHIKWTSPGNELISFFKVINWYSSPNTSQIVGVDVESGRLFIKDCLPAKEADFVNYQQSKA